MKIAHNNTLSPPLKPSAANRSHRQKEETMNTKKTILYERLSHEDGRENESVSIKAAEAAERAAILQGTPYEIKPDQSEESEVKKSA